MFKKLLICLFAVSGIALIANALQAAPQYIEGWGWTNAPTRDTVANTRHNLSFSYMTNELSKSWMTSYAGVIGYGEVCVYCHTPHGAGTTELKGIPLWNRTATKTVYEVYNRPLASGNTPSQPGPNSLTCLSCHDGTIAVDSIMNMPGTGRYDASVESTPNESFNNTFPGANPGYFGTSVLDGVCTYCHDSDQAGQSEALIDFYPYLIGESGDLTEDHPIGIEYPDNAINAAAFRVPTGFRTYAIFFDEDGDNNMDKEDVRLYSPPGSSGTYRVECASCHDPHGVMSNTTGYFIPSFLRKSNENSELCLTCHIN